jgi:hypothetical protein
MYRTGYHHVDKVGASSTGQTNDRSESLMGIGVSIFLIAVGAILTFAVHATLSGVSIQTIGVILMVVGVIGLLVTMLIFAPRSRARGGVVEERVYDDRPATY